MPRLVHAARTHPGVVRPLNEDSFVAAPPVFVVADGVGGHRAGEVASALVAEEFERLAQRAREGAIDADAVASALSAAQERVRSLHDAADDAGAESFGAASTACGAVAIESSGDPYWVMFNVGDSRLYRLSAERDRLDQISVDHSHVQELVDLGILTPAQAVGHPDRNLVTRAVGADADLEADYWMRPMVTGERLLVCSDGLLDTVDDDELKAVLTASTSVAAAADQLLDLSLTRGARDNVTVVVVDVLVDEGDDGPTPQDVQHRGEDTE